MEYVKALSIHFSALFLFFMGAMGLVSAAFGNVSFEFERAFFSIMSETRSRKLSALLGSLCLFIGGGVFLLAVQEFRPPSYPLLLLGSLIAVAILLLIFKLMFRSVEAMESTLAKGTLLLVNGLILFLLLMAAFYVGQYLWRAFIAV